MSSQPHPMAWANSLNLVIEQVVLVADLPQYWQLQNQLATSIQAFPGFLNIETVPIGAPIDGQQTLVTVLSFDTVAHLSHWLDSDVRRQLLDERIQYLQQWQYRFREMDTGIAVWFQSQLGASQQKRLPPVWKQVWLTVMGLFPTVLFLHLVLGPIWKKLALRFALELLITNMVTVTILSLFVMPIINHLFKFWLKPDAEHNHLHNQQGIVLIILFLGLILWLGLGVT